MICEGSSARIIAAARSWSSGTVASSQNTWATAFSPIFGYPQAHAHDAERAVRAGLNLVEAVPKLATHAGSPIEGSSDAQRNAIAML
jgi:hypothetical protein